MNKVRRLLAAALVATATLGIAGPGLVHAADSTTGCYALGSSNLILANCGFETPDLGISGSSYKYNPPAANPPYTFNSGSGIAALNSAFNVGSPPQGTQVGFLQSYQASITRTVTFPTNGTYTLSFSFAGRAGFSDQRMNVYVGGHPLGTFLTRPSSPAGNCVYAGDHDPGSYCTGSNYLSVSIPFIVSSGATTLQFLIVDPQTGDQTTFIDDLSIVAGNGPGIPPITATPEAPSSVLFGAGAALVLLVLRRRTRNKGTSTSVS